MPTRAQHAKFNIARKELGMTEPQYRDMLFDLFGVESTKKLSYGQAEAFLKHLQRLGWKPKPSKRKHKKPTVAASVQPLINKVEALLAEAKRPWSYADAMAKRMYGVDQVAWLNPKRLRGIIAALTNDAKRHGRRVR